MGFAPIRTVPNGRYFSNHFAGKKLRRILGGVSECDDDQWPGDIRSVSRIVVMTVKEDVVAKAKEGPKAKPKDPELIAFGDRLRELRLDADLTQEELALEAGLHWTYIGQIERGERNLTYRNILRLARGLRVSPAELVAD